MIRILDFGRGRPLQLLHIVPQNEPSGRGAFTIEFGSQQALQPPVRLPLRQTSDGVLPHLTVTNPAFQSLTTQCSGSEFAFGKCSMRSIVLQEFCRADTGMAGVETCFCCMASAYSCDFLLPRGKILHEAEISCARTSVTCPLWGSGLRIRPETSCQELRSCYWLSQKIQIVIERPVSPLANTDHSDINRRIIAQKLSKIRSHTRSLDDIYKSNKMSPAIQCSRIGIYQFHQSILYLFKHANPKSKTHLSV